MQEQLSELQQKLAKEEEDKVTVSKLNDELRTTSQELDKVRTISSARPHPLLTLTSPLGTFHNSLLSYGESSLRYPSFSCLVFHRGAIIHNSSYRIVFSASMDDRKYTIQILIIHKMDFLYFHSHAPSIACRSLQRQRVNLN